MENAVAFASVSGTAAVVAFRLRSSRLSAALHFSARRTADRSVVAASPPMGEIIHNDAAAFCAVRVNRAFNGVLLIDASANRASDIQTVHAKG